MDLRGNPPGFKLLLSIPWILAIAFPQAAPAQETCPTPVLQLNSPQNFSVRGETQQLFRLAGGDLNGDGVVDCVASEQFGDMTVFLGAGDGVFEVAGEPRVGGIVGAIDLVDVNDDGQLDLVMNNSRGLLVQLGNGDGTFGDEQVFPSGDRAGSAPIGLETADFNGDGLLDAGIPGIDGRRVAVHIGAGDGTFSEPILVDMGLWQVTMDSGDFDNDGVVDLVTSRGESSIAITFGVGDGTFARRLNRTVTGRVTALVTGDFDGDGNLDVAAASDGPSHVHVFVGVGAGSLTFVESYAVGEAPRDVIAHDLDGDGILDLATANRDAEAHPRSASVLFGRGDGSFGPIRHLVCGSIPHNLFAADVNGDGTADIVTSNLGVGDISVIRNLGDRRFASPASWMAEDNPYSFAAADLDGDGDMDLVTSHREPPGIGVMIGNGNGAFARRPVMRVTGRLRELILTDLDGDSNPDVAVTDEDANGIQLFFGTGEATFEPAGTLAVGEDPRALAAGDLDGDGDSDLVSGNRQGTISVLLNDGTGQFGEANTFPLEEQLVSPGIDLARFDSDVHIDLVMASRRGVVLLRGLGDGTFDAPRASGELESRPDAVVAGDLDQDGNLDVVALSAEPDERSHVAVLYGDGNGEFTVGSTATVGYQAVDAAIADLDGNGLRDLAVVNWRSYTVSVLLAREGRSFDDPIEFVTGHDPREVLAIDIDDDGDRDLLTCDSFSDTITVIDNLTGDGSRCGPQFPGDTDQDGDVTINDPLRLLGILFPTASPIPSFPCEADIDGPGNIALLDWQGDGEIDISDAVTALRHIFLNGPPHAGMEAMPGCRPIPGCPEAPGC